MSATTHHAFFAPFEKYYPAVKLVRDRRVVDNGKFVSAGGLTSGIDGALYVISKLLGQDVAQRTAEWMEHHSEDWKSAARA